MGSVQLLLHRASPPSRVDGKHYSEAQLVSLSNEMEGLMTEVVRLQARGAEEAGNRVAALVDQLHEESAQLRQFEREAVEV